MGMKASVVLNVHQGTDFDGFCEATDSVLGQEYDDMEVVVVVSDAPSLEAEIAESYGRLENVRIVALEDDDGLSTARNYGAEVSEGDIVVFTDDDVIAEPDWLSHIVQTYEAHEPDGVGGRAVPIWPAGNSGYLPDEFYWLVGVMHDNFVDVAEPQPVRNTFGCNISFDRDVFIKKGGFREDLGKNTDKPLQGEEAEFCERLDGEFWYTPHATVRHKVDTHQLSTEYLLKRAFWQGYSKAELADDMSDESSFLQDLLCDSIPRRLKRPTTRNLGEVAMLLLLTGAVGSGFLYGKT